MKDSATIIRGALDLQDKVVEHAMTPIDKVKKKSLWIHIYIIILLSILFYHIF